MMRKGLFISKKCIFSTIIRIIVFIGIGGYYLMSIITSIIMMASNFTYDNIEMNGFNSLAKYCGNNLRNTVLANVIISGLQILNSYKMSKKEKISIVGSAVFIINAILASIITVFYVQSNNGVCNDYFEVTKKDNGIIAPYYVVINQIAIYWIMCIIGILVGIFGCIMLE